VRITRTAPSAETETALQVPASDRVSHVFVVVFHLKAIPVEFTTQTLDALPAETWTAAPGIAVHPEPVYR
jgi:hypothetical protein